MNCRLKKEIGRTRRPSTRRGDDSQTVVNIKNRIETDNESRGHVKGDNSSDLQPLMMKDGHGVQMVRNRPALMYL